MSEIYDGLDERTRNELKLEDAEARIAELEAELKKTFLNDPHPDTARLNWLALRARWNRRVGPWMLSLRFGWGRQLGGDPAALPTAGFREAIDAAMEEEA